MPTFEPRFESHRSPVLSRDGVVASSQPLATAAGLALLRAGGNAADAAVATAAALAVTEPCSTGLGGDCFALYYDSSDRGVTALNGSGRAPAALDLERVRADGFDSLPRLHPHTVTVPGACAGWCDFIERHGTQPMEQVLAPAIELAERGYPVSPNTAFIWGIGFKSQLDRSPGGHELSIDGRAPRAGEVFRNPGMVRALRRIAEKGKDGFYQGDIAEGIVSVLASQGGVMSEADLAEHRSTWEEPISTVYRDLRVWECPPNGQGLAALLGLNFLRGADLPEDPSSADRYHWMIEAMRIAFADARRWVADPAFAELPVAELLSEAYAAERRRGIDPRRANPGADPGEPLGIGSSDTVYLCAADGDGNACSFINSNYMAFGTGIVPEGWGFSLQNRGFAFSLEPDHANALAPRKRPYHTIIPGLLTRESDGSLYGPFGVMGGFMQPQGHVQVVAAMADDDLDPQAALDRARFNLVQGTASSPVAVEDSVPAETVTELKARGHDVSSVSGWGRIQFGRGQIIRRDASGVLWGGSDPRADGCAMPV